MDKQVTKIVSQMAAMQALFVGNAYNSEPIKGTPGSSLSKAEQAIRKAKDHIAAMRKELETCKK